MTPTDFPESNSTFKAPEGWDDSQCQPIKAYHGDAHGQLDGTKIIIVCWQPTAQERREIAAGANLYVTFVSGIVPHFITTEFKEASNC